MRTARNCEAPHHVGPRSRMIAARPGLRLGSLVVTAADLFEIRVEARSLLTNNRERTRILYRACRECMTKLYDAAAPPQEVLGL